VEVGLLSRSSTVSLLHDVAARIAAIGSLADATVSHDGEYPGWDPNPASPTLAICRQVYEKLFGEAPQVMAIHAGLECGIIGQRVGGMDMVSFGPTITGAHTPDERVFVASVQKSWDFLIAVLGALART
jgi:dipeptidase D